MTQIQPIYNQFNDTLALFAAGEAWLYSVSVCWRAAERVRVWDRWSSRRWTCQRRRRHSGRDAAPVVLRATSDRRSRQILSSRCSNHTRRCSVPSPCVCVCLFSVSSCTLLHLHCCHPAAAAAAGAVLTCRLGDVWQSCFHCLSSCAVECTYSDTLQPQLAECCCIANDWWCSVQYSQW